MKKNPFILSLLILLFFFLSIFSCSHNSYAQLPKGIYQILGQWEAKSDGGIIYENWKMNPDSSLEGKDFILKSDNDTLMLEHLEIKCIEDTVYYIVTVFGQNNNKPVYFKIIEFTPMVFAFENKQHDFPQMIRYSIKTEDIYTVIIEGPEPGNQIKSIEYRFNRKK
jgi:hypothetical protein